MSYGEGLLKLNPCGAPLILTLLNGFGTSSDDMRVLDAGCGRGTTLKYLSEKSRFVLTGLESDETYAATAGENADVDVVAGDICSMPFEVESFDAVIMECVFSLLSEPQTAAAETARVMKKGGVLILSDMISRNRTCGELRQNELIKRLYTMQEITRFFEDSGFDLIYYEDRTRDLQRMLAQMILDGSACSCFSQNDSETLRRCRAGYGLFVLEKI